MKLIVSHQYFKFLKHFKMYFKSLVLILLLTFIASYQNDNIPGDLIGEWCLFHVTTSCHVDVEPYKLPDKVNSKVCVTSLVIKENQRFISYFGDRKVTETWKIFHETTLYLSNVPYGMELKNDTLILRRRVPCGGHKQYSFIRKKI